MGWITQRAFAELLGVSGAAVSKAVKRGRLDGATRPSTTGTGVEIDADEGVRLWRENNGRPDLQPHPVKVGVPEGGKQPRKPRAVAGDQPLPGDDVGEAGLPEVAISRKRTEHFKALQAELDYRKDIGQYVAVDEVAKHVEREYAAIRARLLAVKVSMAPELQGLDDLAQIEAIIDQYINEALQELSDPHAVGTTSASALGAEAAA